MPIGTHSSGGQKEGQILCSRASAGSEPASAVKGTVVVYRHAQTARNRDHTVGGRVKLEILATESGVAGKVVLSADSPTTPLFDHQIQQKLTSRPIG